MPLVIEVPDELAAHLRALATARNEDVNRYAVAALADYAARQAPEPPRIAEYSSEEDAAIEAALHGPFHPFDAVAARKKARRLRDDFTAAR